MNKFLRKAMALALAGTMTLGMGVTTFAENSNLNTNKNVANDTTEINLIKNYIRGDGSATDSISPKEDFEFTITPYGVWNAGSSTGKEDGDAYAVNNMPALAKVSSTNVTVTDKTTKVIIKADAGQAGKDLTNAVSTNITLNDYNSVGDFWYQVVETNKELNEKPYPTTGVIYGTNDNAQENLATKNGAHTATYYIHVQVTNDNAKGFYRTVTLHKTAPTQKISNTEYEEWYNKTYNNDINKKVKDIQNTYYAGDLSIKKEVTGNAGDKNKRFEVTVTFTKPAGTVITSDIAYSAAKSATATSNTEQKILGQDDNNSGWMTTSGGSTKIVNDSTDAAYAQVKIYIKDGDTVTFKNIPYGVTYTVAETRPADDKYTNKMVFINGDEATNFNGVSLNADTGKYETDESTGDFFADNEENKATGSISDASDVLTITNNKESVIDIGVITSNAPYVAILVFAAAAMALYVRRRKDMIEE